MTKEEYLDFCLSLPGAAADQPFRTAPSRRVAVLWVVRHTQNRRWFAVVMEKEGQVFVNLKGDPMEMDFLRGQYQGILPGYHMDHGHWSSVYLVSDVPGALLCRLTEQSHALTGPKNSRKRGQAL